MTLKNQPFEILCENWEMLVTCIFSFSHNVFLQSKRKFIILVTFHLSSANAFSLDQSKILSFGKELTLYQTTFFLDWIKFKALNFVDDRLSVAKIMISVFHRVENVVRKGEIVGNENFFFFLNCFEKASFTDLLKVGIVW